MAADAAREAVACKINGHGEVVAFIWSHTELRRRVYKQADYGKFKSLDPLLNAVTGQLDVSQDAVA